MLYRSKLPGMAGRAGATIAIALIGVNYPAQTQTTAATPQSKTRWPESVTSLPAHRANPEVTVPDLSPEFLAPSASERVKELSDLAAPIKVTGHGIGSGPWPRPLATLLTRSPSCKNADNDFCYYIGGKVLPPVAVSTPEPAYPSAGSKARMQGIETLRVIVGVDGNVHDPRIVKSLSPAFDAESIAAVQRWKFKPASRDGKPVAVIMNIEVDFHLAERPAPTSASPH
jgi:TonB family protein